MSWVYRWEGNCPTCHTPTTGPERLVCSCGTLTGHCRCATCGREYVLLAPFWRVLGLDVAPTMED